ncbi:Uncharacterised protein [Vibrio cholerae]|nr:Uncharacterised protein [Vibrio cholerae]
MKVLANRWLLSLPYRRWSLVLCYSGSRCALCLLAWLTAFGWELAQ